MTEFDREKLANYQEKYISIGITRAGERYNSFAIPWESSANAFNMRTPDIFMEPADLEKGFLTELNQTKIIDGCYIFCPLEDYSFLKELTRLKDLSIYHAEKFIDFSFWRELTDCRLVFLHQGQLPCIDPPRLKIGMPSLALYDCEIADLSNLEGEERLFYELIVANPKKRNERKRWENVRALTKRYYDWKP